MLSGAQHDIFRALFLRLIEHELFQENQPYSMSSRAELTEKWAILRKLLKTVISRSAPSVLQLAVINLEQSKTAIQHNVQ
jgi:hypothetical protein